MSSNLKISVHYKKNLYNLHQVKDYLKEKYRLVLEEQPYTSDALMEATIVSGGRRRKVLMF